MNDIKETMDIKEWQTEAEIKKGNLTGLFKIYGKVIIAFSGGVDSTFMLKIARDAIGDDVIAVTIRAPIFPTDESGFAEEFCRREGIEHRIIDVDILSHEEFVTNDKDRCYTCKKLLFEDVIKMGAELGIINMCEGSIVDDDDDYRPGKRAIKELGVLSPMKEVGLTKDEIRYLSKEMGLPTWDKPSMACLASRFPYGNVINKEQLLMVEEAEKYLMGLGFDQVRVRIHDDVARIEVATDSFEKIMMAETREKIYDKLSGVGFGYVALDLKGYRTGSMNEALGI